MRKTESDNKNPFIKNALELKLLNIFHKLKTCKPTICAICVKNCSIDS